MPQNMNIGIVADWLVTYAGAERVIKEFVDLYPSSELYSIVDFLSDESRQHFHNKKSKLHLFKNSLRLKVNIRNICH